MHDNCINLGFSIPQVWSSWRMLIQQKSSPHTILMERISVTTDAEVVRCLCSSLEDTVLLMYNTF